MIFKKSLQKEGGKMVDLPYSIWTLIVPYGSRWEINRVTTGKGDIVQEEILYIQTCVKT